MSRKKKDPEPKTFRKKTSELERGDIVWMNDEGTEKMEVHLIQPTSAVTFTVYGDKILHGETEEIASSMQVTSPIRIWRS